MHQAVPGFVHLLLTYGVVKNIAGIITRGERIIVTSTATTAATSATSATSAATTALSGLVGREIGRTTGVVGVDGDGSVSGHKA